MKTSGFTLVELIATMVIVGILAIAALPRFFDRQTFDARGLSDRMLAMLRYGQKIAIAQHRNVFVRLDGASVALCFDVTCTAANWVLPPSGSNSGSTATKAACSNSTAWFCEAVPSGIAYSPVSVGNARFFFNALGKPFNAVDLDPNSSFTQLDISITGDGITRHVYVEQETGYVHP